MDYLLSILINISIFVPLALSLDLLVGRTGILSLSHAGIFGIGAYATAIFTKNYDYSFSESVIIGILVSGVFAYMLSKVLSKLKGDYYTLGSFGANIILVSIFLNLEWLTGGASGVFNIPGPEIFGFQIATKLDFLVLSSAFAFLVLVLVLFLARSKFVLVLESIRDDELCAKVFGYKTEQFKTAVFVLAAIVASAAGSIYAVYITVVEPNMFTLNESILLLTMIIVGGLASTRGAILGTILILIIPEVLRFVGLPSAIAAQARMVIYGLILMYVMYFRTTGMFGKYLP